MENKSDYIADFLHRIDSLSMYALFFLCKIQTSHMLHRLFYEITYFFLSYQLEKAGLKSFCYEKVVQLVYKLTFHVYHPVQDLYVKLNP